MRLLYIVTIALVSLPALAETVIVKGGYWLRSKESLDGNGVRINRTMHQGVVLKRDDKMTQVRIGQETFWVSNEALLADAPAPQTRPENGGKKSYFANEDRTTVRTAPGTKNADSEISDYIDQSTELNFVQDVKDTDGDTWYLVSYDHGGKPRQGYVYSGRVHEGDDSGTETLTCPDGKCGSSGNQNVQDNQDAANAVLGVKGIQLPSTYAGLCSTFISPDGPGKWGKKLLSAVDRIAPDCFFKNKQVFKSLCPGYNKAARTKAEKQQFILMLFAAMATQESGCNPTKQAKGINDIADGMFQLEFGFKTRKGAGRNADYCRTRGPVNSQDIDFQTECAVSTVEDTICHYNNSITANYGYWQELHSVVKATKNVHAHQGYIIGRVMQTVKNWSMCK